MKRNDWRRILLSVLAVIMLFPPFSTFAASGSCLSEIKIAVGKEAITELEKKGYTVIYQNLNHAPGSGEMIYMGYKTGDDAITGLVVSPEKRPSLSIGSVTYTLVSEKDLNAGTAGFPLYLYCTKDKKAGDGIVALLSFSRNPKNDAALPDFFSDGSVPVRTADGSAADFEAGIDGYELYFFMIRRTVCLPYISEIKTVEVANGDRLLSKLTSTGCDYFIDAPICTSGNTATYLCYNRTADKAQAVRYVAVSDTASLCGVPFTSAGKMICDGKARELFFTRSERIGNPITDITLGAVMGEDFTLGDWARSYFGGKTTAGASKVFNEEAYGDLTQSKEEYTQLPVNCFENEKAVSGSGLYIVLGKNGLTAVADAVAKEVKSKNGMAENAYPIDGQSRDIEDNAINKQAEEDEKTADGSRKTEEIPGSAIGGGSLIAIAAFLVAAMTVTGVCITASNRRKRKDSEVSQNR